MDRSELLREIRRTADDLRARYAHEGRAAEFDRYIARKRAQGRWPFQD